MKIVIDMSEEIMEYVKNNGCLSVIYTDEVAKAIINGTPYEDRPQGEWIITGEEQGALGITYKIRKCDKCGWEHSLVIPDNFCPNCGVAMRCENDGNKETSNRNTHGAIYDEDSNGFIEII